MSIRDEQKEQRRALIIDKAIELFAKKGYSDTKIGDIAKAADMSVGLMFHYFESKEKLFEEIVRYGANATNTPREMNFENPLDYFEGFLKVMLQYSKEHPQAMYLFVIMRRIQKSEEFARGCQGGAGARLLPRGRPVLARVHILEQYTGDHGAASLRSRIGGKRQTSRDGLDN